MAYTPNTWVVGDVITADKLNALEQAVAAASNAGGGVDAAIWNKNSVDGWQVEGDFNAALAKISTGKPVVAIYYPTYFENTGGYIFEYYQNTILGAIWDSADPNKILLPNGSSTGFEWTANGITYYD